MTNLNMKKHYLALPLITALGLSACGAEQGIDQGLAPQKQPEISMVRYAHDVELQIEDGVLSAEEKAKLHAFLDRHNAGYGDLLQLDDPAIEGRSTHYEAVRKAIAARGLSLHVSPIAYGVRPADGKARVVITRHAVQPPACPDWSGSGINNWTNAQSSNFGCATKTNLAAQVANPRDLLEGQVHSGPEPTATVNAITTYRNRKIGTPATSGGSTSSGSGAGSSSSSSSGGK
ncbi:MAG: CpaD family pilus assembly lipoprotein [Sphingomonadales bacterium]|jgi:pilus assembly protein CpaD